MLSRQTPQLRAAILPEQLPHVSRTPDSRQERQVCQEQHVAGINLARGVKSAKPTFLQPALPLPALLHSSGVKNAKTTFSLAGSLLLLVSNLPRSAFASNSLPAASNVARLVLQALSRQHYIASSITLQRIPWALSIKFANVFTPSPKYYIHYICAERLVCHRESYTMSLPPRRVDNYPSSQITKIIDWQSPEAGPYS